MRKICFLSVMLLAFTAVFASNPIKTNQNQTGLEILTANETSVEFLNHIGDIQTMNVKSEAGSFLKLQLPGYYPSVEYGMPDLPEISRMIEIPYGAKPKIEILSFDEEIIFLNELGIIIPIMPAQPSVNKGQDPESIEFVYNEAFYNSGNLYAPEMVEVQKSGKLRGVQMARVAIRPFQYNAAENTLIVRNNIRVRIDFEGGDLSTTRQIKEKYYSPAFESVFSKLINYKAPESKDALSQYPIKYVIVSDPMFETALQPFIEWKTKKGFYVVEAYTDDPAVGTTTASIKSYLQGLYEAGTAADPSPSFVLFVGDIAQIPVFDGDAGSHKTDMYYCEYDGGDDYMPEVYYGRFSATSVAELTPQIHKTLQFEMFTMPDPAYLAQNVFVAGVDSGFGDSHANGQVNYGTNEYFNAAHGITSHIYHYPESGDSEAAILADVTAGAGFVNYTAHCSEDGWADPSFTISDVANLNNEDMYYVGVSNCCLSNKFDVDCFGEALLRAENEGAVAHLGGSNNTLWDEDYYWSVGLISDPIENPTFEQTETGVYDALFHENGEEPYITTAQMNYVGNLSVESSSSSNKEYYWEIYHVLGDPSLMPYLGIPAEMTVDYLDPQPMGTNSLTVTTEAGAYVAISLNGVLLDVKLADASGVAELTFDAINAVESCDVVVTKQNRQPYIGTLEIIPNDSDYDVQLSAINTPQNLMFIDDATFQPEVNIRNLGQLELTSASVNYQIDGGTVVTEAWTGSLNTFDVASVTFPEITLDEGTYTFKAWAVEPNGETDEYPQNDTLTKIFTVYSGDVSLASIVAPDDMNCNIQILVPEITVRNNDANPLTSLTVGYTCGSVADEFVWTGSLEAAQEINIQFDPAEFPGGLQTISFYIEAPNGGTDMDVFDNTDEKEFRVTIGQTVELDFLTDGYPGETSWDLVEDATGDVLYSNGSLESETHHVSNWCLGQGCYTFTVYDSYNDGMGGTWFGGDPGEVVITNTETEEVYGTIAGDSFESDASIEFCIEMSYFTASPTDLDFGDVKINETAELTYQVSGAALSSDVTITAPDGFLISLESGASFTDELIITPIDGEVSEQIFVSFTPESEAVVNGNIINATDGYDSVEVSLTGNGVVGIESNQNMDVTLYPNPSSGIVFVEADRTFDFEVIDALGRILMKGNSESASYELNLSEYAGSLFVVKVITEQGTKIMQVQIVR
jgi:hypothetical protein